MDLTRKADSGASSGAIERLASGLLNARVSDHLEFREPAIRYQDSSGWGFELAIEKFSSRRTESGERIVLDSQGALNGLPYSLSGSFANPRGGAGGRAKGPFGLEINFAGLAAKIDRALDVSDPVATIDAQLGLAVDSLATLLELLWLEYETGGRGTLDARLTGSLDRKRNRPCVVEDAS
jgi:hypothetical protein